MGTATLSDSITIMSSSVVHQQELTLVAVCRKIVDSVSSRKPMKGDLVEIPHSQSHAQSKVCKAIHLVEFQTKK